MQRDDLKKRLSERMSLVNCTYEVIQAIKKVEVQRTYRPLSREQGQRQQRPHRMGALPKSGLLVWSPHCPKK